jgi:hypothetical protein
VKPAGANERAVFERRPDSDHRNPADVVGAEDREELVRHPPGPAPLENRRAVRIEDGERLPWDLLLICSHDEVSLSGLGSMADGEIADGFGLGGSRAGRAV